MERATDSFGYEWLALADDDFEDLVTTVHVAAQSMTEEGFGEQLLCAVFTFVRTCTSSTTSSAATSTRSCPGRRERDSERELQLQGKMEKELPIEPELERWFPLWDAPV